MKKRNVILVINFLLIVILFTSCAPEEDTVKEYGFFYGILHGFVFIFSLIGKVIGLDIGLYAENNSGFFYWIGFIIGLGGLGGGGASSRRN